MADFTRSIQDIVEALKQAKGDDNIGCSLLIGAGCSFSANIPTGQGFVEKIKEERLSAYERAKEKTYPHCMGQLETGFQRKLIIDAIEESKINWAHICIAVLIQKGYVDRVLTTNFDPLISRACALLGEFPAVYDFAASQDFKPEHLPKQAIFHLHGQHTGFALLHTEAKTKALSKSLKPVFKNASQGRLWIVVGYSGECDPVFDDHLSKVKDFEYGLYWVGYKDDLESHVRDKLLSKNKSAYHIAGHDADSFFIELTRGLEIFPPELITKPFHHLDKLFDGIQKFPSREGFTEKDMTETARQQIKQAMKQAEENDQNILAEAERLLMSGDYKATLKYINKNKTALTEEKLSETEAWAYIVQGNTLDDLSQTQSSAKQQDTFKLAGDKFQQATQIKPDKHEAIINWGIALNYLARTQSIAKQQATFKLAGEKYQQAIKIKPDMHEAIFN
jgi:NAD-dependent SIR2 family protein deacetylase